jgi:hypothetical protein
VRQTPRRKLLDRDQIDAAGFRAKDGKRIDLIVVRAASLHRVAMMSVTAADRKSDRALTKSPGLALNAAEAAALLDDQVVARVFTERQEHAIPDTSQRKDDREG